MRPSTITPFVTGDYTAPPGHRLAGQRVLVVAYLIRHPDAVVLLDTGFPFDSPYTVTDGEVELPTYPRSLESELAALDTSLAEVDVVVNCHLHIDHAGGNFRVPAGTPIYVQEMEYAANVDETEELVRDALALDRQAYRRIEGETEILPGITALPTPGHTAGHQSLIVETAAGLFLLGGQSMPSASDFALAMYTRRLEREGNEPVPDYPAWLPRIAELNPVRAMFAHDLAVWEPSRST